MDNFGAVFAAILLVLAAIIGLPFLQIWCINTLWDLSQPYDFQHWLAALFIGGVIGGVIKGASSCSK